MLNLGRWSAPFLAIHLFFVIAVCCNETFWLISQGLTVIPARPDGFWSKAEGVASVILGEKLSSQSSVRRTLALYLNAAGIETGYAYFAPNVPEACNLIVELDYSDGHVEYETPQVSEAVKLRVDAVFGRMQEDRFIPLRHALVKRIAYSVWRRHPDVDGVKAFLGWTDLPTVPEFEQRKNGAFHVLETYEFRLETE